MASWKDRANKVEDAAPAAAEGWKARAKPVAVPSAGVPGIPNVTPPAGAPSEQGYSGITPTDVLNFSTSVGENIPILGPLAVAGGERFGAGLKYLTDKAMGEDVTYEDALAAIQAQNEMRRAEKLEESPIAAGVAAPLMGAAMIPSPFEKIKGAAGVAKNLGAAGAAKRIGANVALTAADDLARGDVEGVALDTGLVGGIQTIIEAAPSAKKLALSRALKAAFGQQKRAFTETAKQAGKLERTGEALLAADEAGPAVVRFGSTPEDIAPRAKAKKEFFGKEIENVGKAVDAVVPQSVSGPDIAAKIRAELEGIAVNKETEGVRQRLTELANEFWEKGDISFAEAQKHRNSFKYKASDGTAQVLPQDVRSAVNMAIGQVMEDTVGKVAHANGMPELAEQYAKAKEGYGIYKPAAKFAEDRALGDRAVRALSPSDLYAAGTLGTGAFLGSMLNGGSAGESSGMSTTAALMGAGVNNLVRRRGSAAAAVTAKFIGDLLETQPAVFGKFQGKLKAAQQAGSKALIGTHEALLHSPEYGSLINAVSESLGSQDGDVAVIDNPALLTGYRLSLQNNKVMPSTAKAKALSELNQNGYYTMDLAPYRQEYERQMIPAAPGAIGGPSVDNVMKALQASVGK